MYFYCTYSKNENIINAGYWVLYEIAKINPEQEKAVCPKRKNYFPQNTKNRQSAKLNSRKNFVPHGTWNNDRSFDQAGPGRYFTFLTCVSSGLLDHLCNHQLCFNYVL